MKFNKRYRCELCGHYSLSDEDLRQHKLQFHVASLKGELKTLIEQIEDRRENNV